MESKQGKRRASVLQVGTYFLCPPACIPGNTPFAISSATFMSTCNSGVYLTSITSSHLPHALQLNTWYRVAESSQGLKMDAVGLASSIISFIEVASKIIRGSYEVYTSSTGATEEKDHTGLVIRDLRAVAAALDRNQDTHNDEQLRELSRKCFELSGDLVRLLERFLPKSPGPWQSFKAACLILRKQKQTVALETRLDRYRLQISQRLTLLLL